MFHDFGEITNVAEIQATVSQYLMTNSEKYTHLHKNDANAIMDDLYLFYKTQSHVDSDVCNILVKILAECYKIRVNSFQKGQGDATEHLLFGPPTWECSIWIKFYQDPTDASGNHYNSIVITGLSTPPSVLHTLLTKNDNECQQTSDGATEDPQSSTAGMCGSSLQNIGTTQNKEHYENSTQSLGPSNPIKITQGTLFPTYLCTQQPVVVDEIPPDIDGFQLSKIKVNQHNYNTKTADHRWFIMRTSSNISLNVKQKTVKCGGPFVCNNRDCSYFQTEGKKKQSKFPVYVEKESLWIL